MKTYTQHFINHLIDRADISPGEMLVGVVLANVADDHTGGRIFLSIETIAVRAKFKALNTVRAHIEGLIEKELVIRRDASVEPDVPKSSGYVYDVRVPGLSPKEYAQKRSIFFDDEGGSNIEGSNNEPSKNEGSNIEGCPTKECGVEQISRSDVQVQILNPSLKPEALNLLSLGFTCTCDDACTCEAEANQETINRLELIESNRVTAWLFRGLAKNGHALLALSKQYAKMGEVELAKQLLLNPRAKSPLRLDWAKVMDQLEPFYQNGYSDEQIISLFNAKMVDYKKRARSCKPKTATFAIETFFKDNKPVALKQPSTPPAPPTPEHPSKPDLPSPDDSGQENSKDDATIDLETIETNLEIALDIIGGQSVVDNILQGKWSGDSSPSESSPLWVEIERYREALGLSYGSMYKAKGWSLEVFDEC